MIREELNEATYDKKDSKATADAIIKAMDARIKQLSNAGNSDYSSDSMWRKLALLEQDASKGK